MDLLVLKPLSGADGGTQPLVLGGVWPHKEMESTAGPSAWWVGGTLGEIAEWSWGEGGPAVIVRTGAVAGEGWERWSKAATGELDRWIERAVRSGARVWVRPCAEDVVSDVPSMVAMLKRWDGKVKAVVDPGAMMTAEMMGRAEDHLERVLYASRHEHVAAVVGPDFGGPPELMHAWEAQRAALRALDKPVIVSEEWRGRAAEWLNERAPG